MTFFLDNWWLFAVALGSAAALMWPVVTGGARAGQVTPNNAVMLMNRSKAVLIDVSDAAEFSASHIAQAKHVPLADLEAKLPSVVKNKELPVILVCATGARANQAVAKAQKLGYSAAQSMAGGLVAWRDAGLPLVKA